MSDASREVRIQEYRASKRGPINESHFRAAGYKPGPTYVVMLQALETARSAGGLAQDATIDQQLGWLRANGYHPKIKFKI